MPLFQAGFVDVDPGGEPLFDSELGLSLLPFRDPSDRKNAGFAISPYMIGPLTTQHWSSDGVDMAVVVEAEIQPDTRPLLAITPQGWQSLSLDTAGQLSQAPDLHFRVEGALSYVDASGRMWMIGSETGSRVQSAGTRASLTVSAPSGIVASISALDLQVGIHLSEDELLGSVLNAPVSLSIGDLSFGFSSQRGGFVDATLPASGVGLARSMAMSVALGPILITRLDLSLQLTSPDSGGLYLKTTAGVEVFLRLGPVRVLLNTPGGVMTLDLSGDPSGDLFSYEFVPPVGAAIAVDAGPVVGGGFLDFEEAAGRYSGMLELEVYGFAVKAVGLLDTKLPAGGPAYSFLLVVSTKFRPVPLGLGFTLNGVGGLVGIHRRMDVEAVRTGLRAGTLDHILFPHDPIAHAALLISDLRTVFPPAADRHVLGPMAIIGWGTPTLVEGKLGVLLELPDATRIVLLGQFRATLPRPDRALIALNLDVIGELDLQRGRLALDGRLRDSRVVSFPVEGDLAMRLAWEGEPSFALAIGGFHPDFTPPPGFPTLQRVTIPIGLDDNPRITLEGYLAITSNTLQIGAAASLYRKEGWFNITGDIEFNALFTFSPFSFVTDFSGRVALRKGDTDLAAISLDASISGPTPWHVAGEACLEIRWLPDICVGFDATFGSEERVELPAADPWPALRAALENPESWSGARPAGTFRGATLAAGGAASTGSVLDPAGGITVRETVVPLHRRITRFGEARPPGGADRFDVTAVTVGGGAFVPSAERDFFAPAHFEDLSDDEKLSRPSFERMDAGFTVARDAVGHGAAIGAPFAYDTRIVDSAFESRPGRFHVPAFEVLVAALDAGVAARSPLRSGGDAKFVPSAAVAPLVSLEPERFIVASTADLGTRPDIAAPMAKGAAWQALDEHLAAHPDERGRLAVMSLDEVEPVA